MPRQEIPDNPVIPSGALAMKRICERIKQATAATN
jgi:hypothetical protein